MKKNITTYNITQEDIEHYIASILNEQHEDYPKFVTGIKSFINWFTNKNKIT